MVVLKKHVTKDGSEYLNPIEVFDENCPEKTEKIFALAKSCADVLNYWLDNTPDAFGNAPYARLYGFLYGYLAGAGMELEESEDIWTIRKGKRVVLRVEVPKKPASYYEDMKDIAETRRALFG